MTHPQFQETHDDDAGRMSFISHLGELRRRLMYVVAVLLMAALGCFSFAPELFEILRKDRDKRALHTDFTRGREKVLVYFSYLL